MLEEIWSVLINNARTHPKKTTNFDDSGFEANTIAMKKLLSPNSAMKTIPAVESARGTAASEDMSKRD